jgi:hypothetical protein
LRHRSLVGNGDPWWAAATQRVGSRNGCREQLSIILSTSAIESVNRLPI